MNAQDPPGTAGPAEGTSTGGRVVSALTLGLLVLLALSGTATHPSGVQIGLPSVAAIVLAAALAGLVWTSRVSGLGGFLLPASMVLVAAFFPKASSLLLFSGRPLAAFALGALALAIVAASWRPPKALLLPFFFATFACVAYEAQSRVGPDGDEPQYLMVAESLVRDHDLALDQDFREERYRAFFSRPLEPHFRIRGPEGQIYSLHAIGLPLLILPAYVLGGYAGASFFMALLAAFLVRELRRLVMALSGDGGLAEGTAWLLGLSPPLIHFAGLIFTEIPAALLLCIGLRTSVFGKGRRAIVVASLCAAALPWLNVRYAILSVAVGIALCVRLWKESRGRESKTAAVRPWLAPASIAAGSALAIGLYHFALWGFFDPRRVYGRNREFGLAILPEGLPGLFFDQEFGLFIYAPVFVLSFAGLAQLWKRQRVLAIAGLFALCGVIGTASVWPMWRGGFNPPARFLVPLIPILAASMALVLQRGLRPATALLCGFGLWCGLFGALNIETVHRDRDGVAPFFRTQSGTREWTAALPSFVLAEDRNTRKLALPWAVLLAAAAFVAQRRRSLESRALRHRDTLLVSAAMMGTAILADRMSPRERASEREAIRLVGQPSLLLPAFQFQSATEASWPLDLFYEPHRQQEGLTFARALALSAGRYEICLAGADASEGAAPRVRVTNRRTQATRITMPLDGNGAAMFSIDEPAEFDLVLVGGEPRAYKAARLRMR